jgi:kynurenine formamidase
VSDAGLPSFDDLPVHPDAPPHSAWGVWGDIGTDVLGCLHLLTPERVVRAAGSIRTGRTFGLNLDAAVPDPPLFGRSALTHEVTGRPGGMSHDDLLHGWNTQSSSQWDGFRHVAHPTHGHYGGVADEEHGMHHWARRGIVGRAVLADVARWREAAGRPVRCDQADAVTPDDLRACLDDQGTPVEPGDVLLVRTGWLTWYRSLDADGRSALRDPATMAAPGLAPGLATARLLWDLHVSAVAADNPALEVWRPGSIRAGLSDDEWPDAFVHTVLLPLLGLPIGELFDLDDLAADCAADGTYDCFLASAPLHVRSGVASPPNAVAVR